MGDEAKKGEIDPETAKKLVRLAFSIALRYHPANRDQLEELASAGLVGAGRAVRSYDPGKGASLKTWATHCIRSCILDAIGNNRKGPQPFSLDEMQENYGPVAQLQDDRVPEWGDGGDLTRYFRCLPPKERIVFELHYIHSVGLPQIAKRLGLCRTTVFYRHRNGLRRIRRHISDFGFESLEQPLSFLR